MNAVTSAAPDALAKRTQAKEFLKRLGNYLNNPTSEGRMQADGKDRRGSL
jgi:hypothetical protein